MGSRDGRSGVGGAAPGGAQWFGTTHANRNDANTAAAAATSGGMVIPFSPNTHTKIVTNAPDNPADTTGGRGITADCSARTRIGCLDTACPPLCTACTRVARHSTIPSTSPNGNIHGNVPQSGRGSETGGSGVGGGAGGDGESVGATAEVRDGSLPAGWPPVGGFGVRGPHHLLYPFPRESAGGPPR